MITGDIAIFFPNYRETKVAGAVLISAHLCCNVQKVY